MLPTPQRTYAFKSQWHPLINYTRKGKGTRWVCIPTGLTLTIACLLHALFCQERYLTVSMTVALLLGSVILQHAVGFDRALGGNQSEATLERLLVSYAVIPCIGLIAVFLILLRYPLTRKRTLEIRRALECRREAV
ncbi:hypothetical protein [Pelagicoccus mobilis]|uniref:Uncharacterized protein n=1 Tax=Pelagicoccus mobilis TaxID=415221 RepID=A0A934RYN4_9BACT|nr:hypothetical protein [Pelagicoccus mobilis]MBK1877276.1 hypothetical protein [Pelagicoccus mobilis]